MTPCAERRAARRARPAPRADSRGPIWQPCPTITRLSILVPRPMLVAPSVARSTVALAPISTSSSSDDGADLRDLAVAVGQRHEAEPVAADHGAGVQGDAVADAHALAHHDAGVRREVVADARRRRRWSTCACSTASRPITHASPTTTCGPTDAPGPSAPSGRRPPSGATPGVRAARADGSSSTACDEREVRMRAREAPGARPSGASWREQDRRRARRRRAAPRAGDRRGR